MTSCALPGTTKAMMKVTSFLEIFILRKDIPDEVGKGVRNVAFWMGLRDNGFNTLASSIRPEIMHNGRR